MAYDNSVGVTDFGVTTLTTASFTIGAGADRVAIVCLSTLAAPGTISALSVGGVSGSAIAGASGNDGTWWHTLYKVLDPPSGSQTATATWANSASARLSVITATGASDANGGNYAQNASSSVSINIASNSGDLTATFSGDGNTGTTHSTNQTARLTGDLIGADTGPGTAGPITHTWTHTGAFSANAVGANFVAVATSTAEQEGYRFRDDDGNESGASWLASQDTNITRALATNTRLRVLVNATGDLASTAFELEYQINGGGFSAVPVGSSTKTQPVIEVADVTESGNNTASTTWSISHPNASTGDLLIWCVAWDDSTTTTDLTAPSGPNGETLSVLVGPTASSATSVRGKAFYTVATGSWTAGTRNFTPSASEQWTAAVIRVPAGEFDSSTPIGASNSLASVSTGNPSTPTLTAGASDGSGTLVTFISSDVDDADGTMTGWTSLASTDRGAVGIDVLVRDAAVTNSESISSSSGLTYPAAHDWVSFCFVVRAPTVTNPVYVATSANISASGAATTAQLTAPSGKSTSDFVAGRIQDDENPADAVDITTDDYTELEWCLSTQSPAANTDVVQFRIAGLDTYTVTPQWTIGDSGAISGSSSITFSTTGTLTGTGALTGSSTLTFSPTATIQGLAPITGASTITFTTSGTVIGVGALSGSSTITFSPTATLTGTGALVGSSTLTFTPTATLTGTGALSGSATITFSVSGTLADAGSGVLSGSTTITFTVAGVLTGTGDLAGSTTLTFSPSGVLSSLETSVPEQPSGGFYFYFDAYSRQRLREREEQERLKRESESIEDDTSREIAKLLREQEAKDLERAELERLQSLADRFSQQPLGLPARARAALYNASEMRTRNSLEQMRREIERMLEEEEAMVIAILNDDA